MGWSDADALGVGESSQGMDADAVGSGLGDGYIGGDNKNVNWGSIIEAMRAMYGPPPTGWGNVDAMTGVYGPGSPLDPMSGAATLHGTGIGQRQGLAWGPGIGYGPYNAPHGPVTGISGPPGRNQGYGGPLGGSPSGNIDGSDR